MHLKKIHMTFFVSTLKGLWTNRYPFVWLSLCLYRITRKVCFIPSQNLAKKKSFALRKNVVKNVEIFKVRLHSKIHLKINVSLKIHLAQQRESLKLNFKILRTDNTLMFTISADYRNKSRLSFSEAALILATCLSSIAHLAQPGFGLFSSNKLPIWSRWSRLIIVDRSSSSSIPCFVGYFLTKEIQRPFEKCTFICARISWVVKYITDVITCSKSAQQVTTTKGNISLKNHSL